MALALVLNSDAFAALLCLTSSGGYIFVPVPSSIQAAGLVCTWHQGPQTACNLEVMSQQWPHARLTMQLLQQPNQAGTHNQ